MGSEHDAEMTSDTNSPAPAEGTMRAIVQDAYGSARRLPSCADQHS